MPCSKLTTCSAVANVAITNTKVNAHSAQQIAWTLINGQTNGYIDNRMEFFPY